MRNVRSYLTLSAISLCFVLASCKSPDVEVSSIDKKLPAPQLKSGTSPFDQDMDAQSYVRVQGSCDSRVGNLFISFNNLKWESPPAIPNYTNTSLTGSEVNDFNCADGSFDFYLTKTDLQVIWGVQTGNPANPIDTIYLKGETLIGETVTLVLRDNKSDHNGGGTATSLAIEKFAPTGFAGSGQCAQFWLNVKNASGYNTSYASTITANISKTVDGTTSPNISVHTTMANCDAGTNSVTTLTIPANQGFVRFYYKMPADTPSLGKTFEFNVTNPSALTASSTPASFTLRDANSSTYRYVTAESPNWRLYKNICTKFSANIYNYYNSWATSDGVATDITISSSNLSAKVYSDASCTNQATVVTAAAYAAKADFYVKYVPSAAETLDFASFTLSFSANSPSSPTTIYDSSPISWSVDLTAKNTNTLVAFNEYETFPTTLQSDYCYPVGFNLANANHTPIPLSANVTLTLSTAANAGDVTYFSDSTCNNSISTFNISKDSSNAPAVGNLYFKISPDAVGTSVQFKFTASGISGISKERAFVKLPTMLSLTGNSVIPAGSSCSILILNLTDTLGVNSYPATSDVTVQISGTYASGNLYEDAACTGTPTTTFTITSGASGRPIYFKPNGISTGFTVDLYPNYISGPYSPLGWIKYTGVVSP